MAPLSRFLSARQGDYMVIGGNSPPLSHPSEPSRSGVRLPPTPHSSHAHLSQSHEQMARDLRTSLPSVCPRLGPEEVQLVGKYPMAAGGSADIWEATCGGRKVVLKSYRRYVTVDVVEVVTRLRNEVEVWCLLHKKNLNVVPLVGVFSTREHPFCLVYEYMDGLDVGQYLKNAHNTRRMNLVADIAQDLSRMHSMGIAHGCLQMENILIDSNGAARIAGLGSASILSAPLSLGDEIGIDQSPQRSDPDPGFAQLSEAVLDSSLPAGARDMPNFGSIAWEILTGQSPFSGMSQIAAAYSILNGARPPQPNSNGIPDRVLHAIERCWHKEPSKRVSIGEMVDLLETELYRKPGSCSSVPA